MTMGSEPLGEPDPTAAGGSDHAVAPRVSAPPGSVEAALASLTRAQAEALAPEAEPNALRAVATQLADALHRPDSSPLTEHRDFLTIALRTAYELNNRR